MNAESPADLLPNCRCGSLCVRPEVRRKLWAIAVRLKPDPRYWDPEDLLQEALLRIWQAEQERPRQTVSWYVQNADLHLRNLLRTGRSLDSPKHGVARVHLAMESDEGNGLSGVSAVLHGDGDPMLPIYLDDLVAELLRHLSAPEWSVLVLSLFGLGAREIGRLLNVSHFTVLDRRRGIAALARELWIGPGRE